MRSKLLILLIIFVVLAVFVRRHFFPLVIYSNIDESMNCEDSDSYDIYTKGSILIVSEDGKMEILDECISESVSNKDVNTLIERSCENGFLKETIVRCGSGNKCMSGRCIK